MSRPTLRDALEVATAIEIEMIVRDKTSDVKLIVYQPADSPYVTCMNDVSEARLQPLIESLQQLAVTRRIKASVYARSAKLQVTFPSSLKSEEIIVKKGRVV